MNNVKRIAANPEKNGLCIYHPNILFSYVDGKELRLQLLLPANSENVLFTGTSRQSILPHLSISISAGYPSFLPSLIQMTSFLQSSVKQNCFKKTSPIYYMLSTFLLCRMRLP